VGDSLGWTWRRSRCRCRQVFNKFDKRKKVVSIGGRSYRRVEMLQARELTLMPLFIDDELELRRRYSRDMRVALDYIPCICIAECPKAGCYSISCPSAPLSPAAL